MSYDISLYMEVDTGTLQEITLFDWNYTSNCAEMWRKAGADIAEFHNKKAGECAPILQAAIDRMLADPKTFRAMNPSNGWGDYDRLVPRLQELCNAMKKHNKCVVRVCR